MPIATICDIDDTLISNGEPVQPVIDYVNNLDGVVFIVTGRNESERASTVDELDSAGVVFEELFMNPDPATPTSEFKGKVAEDLLKDFDVTLAVDNNADNRAAFDALGIPTLDPADIASSSRCLHLSLARAIARRV
jgi:hypothetical protein